MEQEDLVSIYTVDNPVEAELIRGALQSAGIPCEINGESQAGLVGITAFEIDIMTKFADAERARELLRELQHHEKIAEDPQEADTSEEVNEAIEEHKPGTHFRPSSE
jgi:Putative prokaryotic signal transducing protein